MEHVHDRELSPDELTANIEAMRSGENPPFVQYLGRVTTMNGLKANDPKPQPLSRVAFTTGTNLSGNPRPEIPRNKR